MTTTPPRDLKSLFLRYSGELRLYLARQIYCTHTAADLVQDAFVRLAQQPLDAGETNPRAYLYRVAHNLAIDHFRTEERRQTIVTPHEEMVDIPDEAPVPEHVLQNAQCLNEVERALAELPALTRQIFQLNRIDGLTHSEVARQLGISDSSVQKHLSRALQHTMQRLRRLSE
ncbi:RNA polymerase sigma factor [Steroidobacter flavus]|uniref:RNA polymerase sigma factor n=1 Tax=Steroidobacter flavus TaxID=1842136 RepID=A0ABV8T4V9_9GAMM